MDLGFKVYGQSREEGRNVRALRFWVVGGLGISFFGLGARGLAEMQGVLGSRALQSGSIGRYIGMMEKKMETTRVY